ncbi:hypothetical protein JCM12298_26740 [Desulfothermus naphthae]
MKVTLYVEISELNLKKSNTLLPTIEVDLNTIPQKFFGYGDIVCDALKKFACHNKDITATVYVYHGQSVNFHELSNSAFFAVVGSQQNEILDILLKCFKSLSIKVMRSNYINPLKGLPEFHVENGFVWQPIDAIEWYTKDVILDEPELVRYRGARDDAMVGTIIQKIEKLFKLPEGSIRICKPDGSFFRKDAKIATVRRHWQE